MDSREQALTDHYLELLARTGEDHRWTAIQFTPTHDGNAHVVFEADGTWSTVVTDRGQEYEREHYRDLHALMFVLCAEATWDAARRQIQEPNLHAHELQDRTQAAQVELMGRIDAAWAHQLDRNYAKWREVRARQAAADRARERLDRIQTVWIYAGCALVVGAALALVLYLD